MSGIYIPDVGLPQDGDFELWIAVKKDGSFIYNVRGGWQDGSQKVIPISPHGDLIDRDALEYEEAYLNGHYELGDVEIVTRKDIESSPIIIPASKESEI